MIYRVTEYYWTKISLKIILGLSVYQIIKVVKDWNFIDVHKISFVLWFQINSI